MQQNGWFMGGLDRYYTTTDAEAGAMFGAGEAAMKIEGTWFVANADDYFGEDAGNENEWGWVPVPSVSGEADLRPRHRLDLLDQRQLGAPGSGGAVPRLLLLARDPGAAAGQLRLAPAPVDLEGQDLTGVDPGLAEILAALNEAFAANNYGYTTWTFWPPESETYLIEEIEKVWAGDMTAEEYLQGIRSMFDAEREAGAVPPIPER